MLPEKKYDSVSSTMKLLEPVIERVGIMTYWMRYMDSMDIPILMN